MTTAHRQKQKGFYLNDKICNRKFSTLDKFSVYHITLKRAFRKKKEGEWMCSHGLPNFFYWFVSLWAWLAFTNKSSARQLINQDLQNASNNDRYTNLTNIKQVKQNTLCSFIFSFFFFFFLHVHEGAVIFKQRCQLDERRWI